MSCDLKVKGVSRTGRGGEQYLVFDVELNRKKVGALEVHRMMNDQEGNLEQLLRDIANWRKAVFLDKKDLLFVTLFVVDDVVLGPLVLDCFLKHRWVKNIRWSSILYFCEQHEEPSFKLIAEQASISRRGSLDPVTKMRINDEIRLHRMKDYSRQVESFLRFGFSFLQTKRGGPVCVELTRAHYEKLVSCPNQRPMSWRQISRRVLERFGVALPSGVDAELYNYLFRCFSGSKGAVTPPPDVLMKEIGDFQKRGASVDRAFALHLAAEYGQEDAIPVICKFVKNVNAIDWTGYTPLMLCTSNTKCINILLRFGASKECRNPYDFTPYGLARIHIAHVVETEGIQNLPNGKLDEFRTILCLLRPEKPNPVDQSILLNNDINL